ncbi:MAG: putative glycolipid-binding domain-containing protein [Firmicutes bacterium]|nr:putative glycolipid-binding domain-containing protein [Bacillota bacterium]
MKDIIWRAADGQSLEYCQFTFEGKTAIRGTVVGKLQGARGVFRYEVACWPDGTTRWARGWVQSDRGELSWTVHRPECGIWLVNGTAAPGLAPCLDVDIGVTPSTNSLAIRRLTLHVGESQDVWACWVSIPELTVHALAQRYTRLSSDVYRYESLQSGFSARLRVDEEGIVQEYPGLWRALSTD